MSGLSLLPFLALALLLFCPLQACTPRQPVQSTLRAAPLTDFAKWERVRDSELQRPSFSDKGIAGASESANAGWLLLEECFAQAALLDKARAVNSFFNRMPYKEDLEAFGTEEYWATPEEFMRHCGDCEDFAIAKYYALKRLGVRAEQMRITGVWNMRKNEGHSVLLVLDNDRLYILDNVFKQVQPFDELAHEYRLIYHVNENTLWRRPDKS
ncbi:transglutaminase-like cysteine peptidase [Desulfovibrio sp. OttesenSCG-928-A18]|nr:transglutaminase-like cysteine peptidase [Desulfovibrio sp. OttesenSCG-928-A18]